MVGCVIRVALLHDEPTVLAALRRLIDRAPDLALVAAALNGESLVEQLRWMRPDVVVIGDPDGIVDGAGQLPALLEAIRGVAQATTEPISHDALSRAA
jgi:chemotaxis response regulator CheB